MIKNKSQIIQSLVQKKNKLEEMQNVGLPTNPSLLERHYERISNMKAYLADIDDIQTIVNSDERIVVLADKKEYEKILKEPGTIIDFDGTFCKVALTEGDYEEYGMYVIYTPPIEKVI